jgi:hypothetical protein
VLDSGAFSAHTSGVPIDLSRYIDDCLALLAGPDPPGAIFALDVIGDPEASARNCERMQAAGVPAVPTFHRGSPWHYLDALARTDARIALGGLALRNAAGAPILSVNAKIAYVEECYARLWPRWCHVFGCTDERVLGRFPVASADSTSWQYGPQRFGKSIAMRANVVPRARLDNATYQHFITLEVANYLRVEARLRGLYGRVLEAAGLGPFSLRLAVDHKNVALLSPGRMASLGA